MVFSASIVHVSLVVVAFLFVTATVDGSNAPVAINATAIALRRSTEALPAANSGEYTCYLCHKSTTMMARRCPIAKDRCHLNCLTLPTPAPPSPPSTVAGGGGGGDRNADDCYVMKVYPDGSWVVVDVVGCKATAPACYLVCRSGDEHGADGAAAADGTTPATPRGALPHALPNFERCGQ